MIRFDQVTKKYPGNPKPALNGLDLEVRRGEFVFLVGASGSGKSSCLQLILKEQKPTKGAIHVLGHDLGAISSRKVPYFRRNLGVVFQDFRLLTSKTVFQNVAFSLQVIGKSRGFVQEAVPDVLKLVGLDGKAHRMPHELSGGEQQRVAIARAVVNKPQILLADEPTGNLDPATSAGIMKLLERINASGTTVVMATHEATIVDKMQRRVIELVDGSIVRDEVSGGYGNTAVIPELGPRPGRGEEAKKAKDAAVEAAAEEPVTRSVAVNVTRVSVDTESSDLAPVERVADPDDANTADAAEGITLPAPSESVIEDTQEHLSLAERLGLRAKVDRSDDDDEQNVGPTQ